jgi:hypothetical protein
LLLASDYHPASDSQLQTQVLVHVQKHQTWCSSLQLLAQGIFFEEILKKTQPGAGGVNGPHYFLLRGSDYGFT